MVTLSNSKITVKIAKRGAEIKSIDSFGKEYMWSADPKIWGKSAPIMFPICGGLKEGRYELFGKSYSMSKHGFARNSDFDVEKIEKDKVTLVLHDSEETRAIYPFKFNFRVSFAISDESLSVTYDVENLSDTPMYASFGAHEGYACPEGIEKYEVIMPEKETLYASGLNGELVTDYYKLMCENGNKIPLREVDFFIDAVVFRNIKNKSVTLKNKENGRGVRVDFPEFDNLVLWHKYNSPYLCIEPWCGLPDVSGSSFDFTEKDGIKKIDVGERLSRTHVITPLK